MTVKHSDIRAIAYYLPQFHQIPENDKWWGEGFTEWVNVKKATPMYTGHEQPKIPYEYYDLSEPDTLHSQISMAKQYNLHGFCFHYYWFKGKRLLETPIECFLDDKSSRANFPFMLCWANENWTRRWDGRDEDVLIHQEHSIKDHQNVTRDLFRYFKDSRYIKFQDKPVFVLYRPQIIQQLERLIEILRAQAIAHGFPGIHIVTTNAFGFTEIDCYDLDGVAEFPPHCLAKINALSNADVKNIHDDFTGTIYDYHHCVQANLKNYNHIKTNQKEHAYYPGVFPSWDNTARRQHNGHVCAGANSTDFHEWLTGAMQLTSSHNTSDDSFVFINAWNEWAEGAFLEPDTVNGYSSLETLKSALENFQHI